MPRAKRTRLTDSSEFERVYRQGTAFRGRLISVHTFQNGLDATRLGLSVSKKVGNAVTRNTVRRRLREIFCATLPQIPGGLDLVVSARPPAAETSFQELEEEFGRALKKLCGTQGSRGSRSG